MRIRATNKGWGEVVESECYNDIKDVINNWKEQGLLIEDLDVEFLDFNPNKDLKFNDVVIQSSNIDENGVGHSRGYLKNGRGEIKEFHIAGEYGYCDDASGNLDDEEFDMVMKEIMYGWG